MTGDSPLLPEALVEIAALGDYLSDIQFDAIFQVLQNVRLIQQRFISEHNQSQDIVKKTELFEWNLGIFEGMLIDEAYQKDPENMAAFRHHPEQFWDNNRC
jgi:probable phosphoglycerate mutase